MRLWRKLRALLPGYRAAQERDMHEELESLKAMAGRNELGNLTVAAENARDVWRWSWLETLWQDVRYSVRTLRKSPGFTVTAIVILSLGIGLNLTLFQLINVVFLKPLPLRDRDSLVHVTVPAGGDQLNYPAMQLVRTRNTVFSAVLMDMRTAAPEHRLEWNGQPTPRKSFFVSPNWFDELGVTALRGRLFSEATEGATDAAPVAVISEGFWEVHLSKDPAIIGSTVRLTEAGSPVTIIGIVPRAMGSFQFSQPDIWVPVQQAPYLFPGVNLHGRGVLWGRLYGRLKPGVSLKAAAEGLRPLLDELAELNPNYRGNNTVALFSGSSNFRQPRTTARIWGIAGIAGSFTLLILVIACANLANLVLSRIVTRVRELSVRVSLGASRTRVMRHILTETVLLSVLGSAGGLMLAYTGSRIARRINQDLFYGDLSLDWRILAVAMIGTIAMTAMVGLMPAWTIGKRDLALAMKDGGEQTSYSLGRVRHRQFLLGAQVAGSCMLIVVAGFMLRTLQRAMDPPGFDADGVLTAERFGIEASAAQPYWNALHDHVAQQPGIESVALSNLRPGSSRPLVVGTIPGLQYNLARVQPSFFQVMRIRFLSGGPFSATDTEGQAIVLSKSLATHVFGTVDVVGRTFPQNGRVAGVVDDIRLTRDEDPDNTEAYAPFGSPGHFQRLSPVVLLARARTASDAARLQYSLSHSLRHLDSQIPVIQILQRDLDDKLAEKELMTTILGSLAVLALGVACMGIFGVVSYGVTLRRKEIGIRLALGAFNRAIIVLMIRQLVLPVSLALVAGLIGGVAAGMVFASEGEYFNPPEAHVAALAVLVLLTAIGISCILPTLRALRTADVRVLSS